MAIQINYNVIYFKNICIVIFLNASKETILKIRLKIFQNATDISHHFNNIISSINFS